MIGHEWTDFDCVDISEREVPHILNSLPAQIAPKQRTRLDMPLVHVLAAQVQRVINNLLKARKTRVPPVHTFVATSMIRH